MCHGVSDNSAFPALCLSKGLKTKSPQAKHAETDPAMAHLRWHTSNGLNLAHGHTRRALRARFARSWVFSEECKPCQIQTYIIKQNDEGPNKDNLAYANPTIMASRLSYTTGVRTKICMFKAWTRTQSGSYVQGV